MAASYISPTFCSSVSPASSYAVSALSKFRALSPSKLAKPQRKRVAFGPGSRASRGGGGFHDPFDIFREAFSGSGGGGSIFEDLALCTDGATMINLQQKVAAGLHLNSVRAVWGSGSVFGVREI